MFKHPFEITILVLVCSTLSSAYPQLQEKLSKIVYDKLDQRLVDVFPKLRHVTQTGIDECFESINDVNSSHSLIFQQNTTLRHVSTEYFVSICLS